MSHILGYAIVMVLKSIPSIPGLYFVKYTNLPIYMSAVQFLWKACGKGDISPFQKKRSLPFQGNFHQTCCLQIF